MPLSDVLSNRKLVLQAWCTETIQWFSGAYRNDWVWITYGDNLVHHRGEVRRRLTIWRGHAATSQKPAIEHCHAVLLVKTFFIARRKGVWQCAAVLPMIPGDFGNIQHSMDHCRVTGNSGDVPKVIQASRIIGSTHVIPKSGSYSLATSWWINSYFDLTISNMVTNDACQAVEGQETAEKRTRGG